MADTVPEVAAAPAAVEETKVETPKKVVEETVEKPVEKKEEASEDKKEEAAEDKKEEVTEEKKEDTAEAKETNGTATNGVAESNGKAEHTNGHVEEEKSEAEKRPADEVVENSPAKKAKVAESTEAPAAEETA